MINFAKRQIVANGYLSALRMFTTERSYTQNCFKVQYIFTDEKILYVCKAFDRKN